MNGEDHVSFDCYRRGDDDLDYDAREGAWWRFWLAVSRGKWATVRRVENLHAPFLLP